MQLEEQVIKAKGLKSFYLLAATGKLLVYNRKRNFHLAK